MNCFVDVVFVGAIFAGVVSGLGKGVTASSIGVLLKAGGWRVTNIKIDPYINIDAGTMSPFEHGEVFVLDDGGEADLDLGNYERFVDSTLTRDHNITTGKIYQSVIAKERKGEYLGKTVQVIPHVTDEIQEWIQRVSQLPVDGFEGEPDVCIIELGGTVGDIESMPFIEALRQFQFRVGSDNFCLIHVSLVPVVGAVGEQKTKPTQHSVQALRSAGLSPHMLACRSQSPLEQSVLDKLALFCHVTPDCILNLCDVSNIWHVPLVMQEQGGHLAIMRQLKLDFRKLDLNAWAHRAHKWDTVAEPVNVAIVGKYVGLGDSYLSVTKALMHSAIAADRKLNVIWVEAGMLEDANLVEDPSGHADAWAKVRGADCILVPGGFGERGTEGKILAAKYARENKVPFLGVCLGMQAAVIEFTRNVLGLKNAHSTEMVPNCADPAVIFMPEGSTTHMGGTMRLGSRRTIFETLDCTAAKLYNCQPFIDERHRHRYEVNPDIVDKLEAAGCVFVGKDDTKRRMEILELDDHPYFVATQYHPEYKSRPGRPSPPFMGLILAASGQLEGYLTSDAINMRVNAPGGFLSSPLKAIKGKNIGSAINELGLP